MKLRTLEHAELSGKTVLLRTDLDVPVDEWQIASEHRLYLATHTIRYLLKKKVKKIYIISQFIENKNQSFSLIRENLSRIIDEKVFFVPTIGDFEGKARIVLYENFSLIDEEQRKSKQFFRDVVDIIKPDIFIEDTFLFTNLYPSVKTIRSFVPCYVGLQLENELSTLKPLIEKRVKIKGLTAIIGGHNFASKVGFLERSAVIAENICIGGSIAMTFLKAQGYNIGQSECEEKHIKTAQKIIKKCKRNGTTLNLPTDFTGFDTYKQTNFSCGYPSILDYYVVYDIGSKTISKYRNIIRKSKLITWNGTMGTCRDELSESGSRAISEFLANDYKGKTIIGGEDTVQIARKFGFQQKYDTQNATLGGTTMLDFLCGKRIPAVDYFSMSWLEKQNLVLGPKIKTLIKTLLIFGLFFFLVIFAMLLKSYLGL